MARIRINPEINPSVEQPILSWFANSYGPDYKQVQLAYSQHTNFATKILCMKNVSSLKYQV